MPRSVRLHARDVAVLELLAHHQIETLAHLHERHWPGCTRKSAYNRLRALANAGYLAHVKRPHRDETKTWVDVRPPAEHLFTLGPKAPVALRLRGSESQALARRHKRGGIPAALIDHQLATNRVADILGARLEQLPATGTKHKDRHRPDGYYHCAPDEEGRDRVLVEVDLGHYSLDRILGKARAFLEDEQARSILFATSTTDRADQVAAWIRETYGVHTMRRVEVYSIEELKNGLLIKDGLGPVSDHDRLAEEPWWQKVTGSPGCR